MNLQILQTIAAVLAATAAVMGAFYTIFTRPLMNLFRSEIKALTAELRAEIGALAQEIKTNHQEIHLEIKALRQEIKAELGAMELRLNDRIDARIVRS
jgi:hypothetical protein